MGQVNSPSRIEIDKSEIKISFEEFIQIVEAVLEGRYSWACVLFLRFAGFNPLHYIPYRTYNRLIKLKLVNSSANSNHIDKNFRNESSEQNLINSENEEMVMKIAAKLSSQGNVNKQANIKGYS
jgi:hypothetical protein